MSKIAHYLQEHLIGEVMTSTDARNYFSSDASIFSIQPAVIIYPRNENDIRKTVRFSWQLAERNRIFPITSRGSGTDTTGAAIGSGLILVFPAHLNHILELDNKSGSVRVEAGINFAKLQQTLISHGFFIPAYPASIEYSTLGGAVANNVSGAKSYKYGSISNYIKTLRVILANGEAIEVGRLNKRELSKKLGLATFEGEIYRSIDTLIEENREVINKGRINITHNNAGYNLFDVKSDDGGFDLIPLLLGSQGTLGIISEVELSPRPYNLESALIMAYIDDLGALQATIDYIRGFKYPLASVEVINRALLEEVHKLNPNQFKDLPNPFPEYILFLEIDELNDHHQKKNLKHISKYFGKSGITFQIETEPDLQQKIIKIREVSSMYLGHNDGLKKAMPIIDDAIVPPNRVQELLSGLDQIYKAVNLNSMAFWGHVGDGNLHLQPHLNLNQIGDRQKAIKLLEEYFKLVISLGGSISGEHGDGRLKTPYLESQYGTELYALMQKTKQIFDPYNIFNPGVKFGTSLDDIKKLIASDFNYGELYTFLPRS